MALRIFLLTYVSLLITIHASAEPPVVQTAIHTAPITVPTTGQVVPFTQATTTVGERVAQRVGMELNLHTIIKQSDQIAHDGTTALRRRQERTIEVLEVVENRAHKAKVTYPLSRVMSPENPDAAKEISQVVEGKSYLITRNGTSLMVTDAEGAIPTQQEFEIVVNSMESFGQSNPLATFLLTREIRVGDRLEVPLDVASKMMGFDSLGEVQRFELHLVEVKELNGKQCAVFAATIAALGKPDNPLNVQAQGNVVIEIATCRTLEATLTGPLSLQTTDQNTEYNATGDLLLAIRSQYSSQK